MCNILNFPFYYLFNHVGMSDILSLQVQQLIENVYINKSNYYLIVVKYVIFTSHTVIILKQPVITSVVITSLNESNQCIIY